MKTGIKMMVTACLLMVVAALRADVSYRVTEEEIKQCAVDGLAELKRMGTFGKMLEIIHRPSVSLNHGVCTVGVTFEKWKVSVPVNARVNVMPVEDGRGIKFVLADVNAGRYNCAFVRDLALKVARYFLGNEPGVVFGSNCVTLRSVNMAGALAVDGSEVPDRIGSVRIADGALEVTFVKKR